MEDLYAIRDAAFWWLGVWAAVTMGNNAICAALKRRRREKREHEYAQWKRKFMEFLSSADAKPEGTETGEDAEAEETGDKSEEGEANG